MVSGFKIIGHRGFGPTDNNDCPAADKYPENSLKSFQYVMDAGADGIELDIFLSTDKAPVVIHDERLHEHVTKDQRKKAKAKPVSAYSYQELQNFDLRGNQKIPRLQDVFQLVSNYPDRRIVNLDVKDPQSVLPILNTIRQWSESNTHSIIISSYNWDILRAFRHHSAELHLVPAIKSAMLFGHENIQAGTYKPLTSEYQKGFEQAIIKFHEEIQAYAFDCSITDFHPALINLAASQGVGLQLSTGNERVSAADTDYDVLNRLQNAAREKIPFAICKVDEPQHVKKHMGLKPN
tara:strand:- start:2705 stop:3583 length:879 start_codon:yes stop_codon:yes gene_type:complete